MNEYNPKILTNPELDNQYDETSFWSKIASNIKKLGREILHKVFLLYYALRDPETPAWAKSVIISALAYFILPLDAIPDIIPFVGFSDDLGVIATALVTVMLHIKPEHVELANQALKKIFKD